MELPAEVAWLSLGFDKLPLQRAEIGDNVAFGLGRELSELIEGCEWLVFAEASDAAEPGAAADDGGTQVPRVAGVSAPVAAELGRSAAAERSRVRGQRLTRGTGRAMIVFHRAGRGRWPRWPNQALQPTTGAGRFPRVRRSFAPAAAELGRSAAEKTPMGRSLSARTKVVGPTLTVGATLSALFASGGPMGWGPVERFEAWASVLAGPFAGLWAAHDWGPADALGWAAASGVAIAAHPLRAGWLTGAASAAGVGLWVLLGLVLTFDGV